MNIYIKICIPRGLQGVCRADGRYAHRRLERTLRRPVEKKIQKKKDE